MNNPTKISPHSQDADPRSGLPRCRGRKHNFLDYDEQGGGTLGLQSDFQTDITITKQTGR